LFRALNYTQTAQGFASLLLSLTTWATVTFPYIGNYFFPEYWQYVAFTVFVLPIPFTLFGRWLKKKSQWYKQQRKIDTEADPYATKYLPPISVEVWTAVSAILKEHGYDTAKLDAITERSLRYNNGDGVE
jgi:hypothetical protein